MPSEGNPRRAFRMEDDDLWRDFGTVAEQHGWDRSSLLRDFITWYAQDVGRATYKRRLKTAAD